jgi:hypothetical protein
MKGETESLTHHHWRKLVLHYGYRM